MFKLQVKKKLFSLYGKRDYFPVSIARYLTMQQPARKMFYASVGAEVLRILKSATKIKKFKSSCATDSLQKDITRRYHKQNQTMSL